MYRRVGEKQKQTGFEEREEQLGPSMGQARKRPRINACGCGRALRRGEMIDKPLQMTGRGGENRTGGWGGRQKNSKKKKSSELT